MASGGQGAQGAAVSAGCRSTTGGTKPSVISVIKIVVASSVDLGTFPRLGIDGPERFEMLLEGRVDRVEKLERAGFEWALAPGSVEEDEEPHQEPHQAEV